MNDVQHPQTYVPTAAPSLNDVERFLAHHSHQSLRLVAPDGSTASVPVELAAALGHIVNTLVAGQAVTVTPQARMLTTQQAADLLGVSRPTVVKLIEAGDIPCDRTGHRRKVAVEDVMDYRVRRKEEQYAALAAIAVDPCEDDDDLTATLAELKQVRKDVAARRRQRKVQP